MQNSNDLIKSKANGSISVGEGFVDARIISLHSRNISFATPVESMSSDSYSSYSYYEKITVLPVNMNGNQALETAYAVATECNENELGKNATQFILAFTDIAKKTDDNECGYTKDEIDSFWGNTEDSLFFLTMVNLPSLECIEDYLKKIKQIFSKNKHLAYLTFDHCSIIIFYRGNCFRDYTNQLLDFAYNGDILPVSTITLYSFSIADNNCYDDEEEFHALIRFGINDYRRAENFYEKIKKLGRSVEMRWFLERNDCGFFCSVATVQWLANVREKAKENDDGQQNDSDTWYNSYELLISVEGNRIDQPGKLIQGKKYPDLRRKFTIKHQVFSEKYIKAVKEIGLTPNMAWLRWLKRSSELAVSLMENFLSEDLGTCLAPQFLDLYEYGERFFEKVKDRDHVEIISKSFSTFFSNVAILIDSMNQSDRQFVQIPPFHLASFEVPPKIMEFYIAVTHKLKKLFHDDKNITYGLLITPQFIKNLGVQSIAVQDVLEDDQWLEIVISESSFYTLQLTTQTLGHEISHFIGQGNRCRAERKEYIIKCAYCNLTRYILRSLPSAVRDIFNYPNAREEVAVPEFTLDDVRQVAESLYGKASTFLEDHNPEQRNRMIFLREFIYSLAENILQDPELYELFCNKIFELAKTPQSHAGQISVVEYLIRQQKWMINKDEEDNVISGNIFLDYAVRDMFEKVIRNRLQLYTVDYGDENIIAFTDSEIEFNEMCDNYSHILYFFSETFADLQSIMVFELNWSQYCDLIKRKEDDKVIADCPQRMLAVAKVLIKSNIWNENDIINTKKEGFQDVEKAIKFKPEENAEELADCGFDAVLTYYLTEYLYRCKKKISKWFSRDENKKQLDELRSIHKALYNENMLDTQKQIGAFVNDFRRSFFNSIGLEI